MTKIDDAMIERAQIEYSRRPDGSFRTPYPNADDVRRVLEAALTPQEPEIPENPVSEGMKESVEALRRDLGRHLWWYVTPEAVCRAVESARRKEAGLPANGSVMVNGTLIAERRSRNDRRKWEMFGKHCFDCGKTTPCPKRRKTDQ